LLKYSAGDNNLYRAERNSSVSGSDPLGLEDDTGFDATGIGDSAGGRFILYGAKPQVLADPSFKINGADGNINVKVRAYIGGRIVNNITTPWKATFVDDYKYGVTFGAFTDCDTKGKLKWLQFFRSTSVLLDGSNDNKRGSVLKRTNDWKHLLLNYYKPGEWYVDSITQNTAFGEGSHGLSNGKVGSEFVVVAADNPGVKQNNKFISTMDEFRTYLVYDKKIIYTIEWNKTSVQDTDTHKWTVATLIQKSGQGALDFPVDIKAAKWPWAFTDEGLKNESLIPSPLK
jgi:hypothetical protein